MIDKVINNFTCNLSTANGSALITNPSVDISKYVNLRFTLEAGGKNLIGYGKAAGAGETYTDIIGGTNPAYRDGNFAGSTWTGQTGWAETGGKGVATNAGVDSLIYQDLSGSAARALTKLTYTITNYTDGSVAFYHGTNDAIDLFTARGSAATFTEYRSRSARFGTWCAFVIKTAGSDLSIDNVTYQIVDTPSATGITIVDAYGSTTQNWTSDSGINLNAVSFTLTIKDAIRNNVMVF